MAGTVIGRLVRAVLGFLIVVLAILAAILLALIMLGIVVPPAAPGWAR